MAIYHKNQLIAGSGSGSGSDVQVEQTITSGDKIGSVNGVNLYTHPVDSVSEHVYCTKAEYDILSSQPGFDENKMYVISDDYSGGSIDTSDLQRKSNMDTTVTGSSGLDNRYPSSRLVKQMIDAGGGGGGGGGSTTSISGYMTTPAGTVLPWMGQLSAIPANYLSCGGQEVLSDDYPELFSAIGTKYGEGTAEGSFRLPDLTDQRYLQGSSAAGALSAANITDMTFSNTMQQVDGAASTGSGFWCFYKTTLPKTDPPTLAVTSTSTTGVVVPKSMTTIYIICVRTLFNMGSDDMTPLIDWDYSEKIVSPYNYTTASKGIVSYDSTVGSYCISWQAKESTRMNPFRSDGRYARCVLPLKEPFTNFRELMFVFTFGTGTVVGASPYIFNINTTMLDFSLNSLTGMGGLYTPVRLLPNSYVNNDYLYDFTLSFCGYNEGSNIKGYNADTSKSTRKFLVAGNIPASNSTAGQDDTAFLASLTRFFEVYGIGRK